MKLSVVISAYNEEKRIGKTLSEISSYLKKKKIEYEIVVVDDASKDKTSESVQGKNVRIIRNKANLGKGASVRKGIQESKYDLILFSDADLSTPIQELDKMVNAIEKGADIAVASRKLPGSKILVKQPFYRKVMGDIFPFLVRLLLLPKVTDSQCGFKLFKSKAAKKIIPKQRIKRFCFDVELLFIAKKLGFKVKEVPVKWMNKKGSRMNPIIDPLLMFLDLLKIKYNDILGRY